MASKIDQILTFAVGQKASDIVLSSGSPPYVRLNGQFMPVNMQALGANAMKHLLGELLTPAQSQKLQEQSNLDLSYTIPSVARFRMNCFMQRQGYSIAARIVPMTVPQLESLGLPGGIIGLLEIPNGLIVITGPSGSGKTTTQAAMIQEIGNKRKDHILTIEDPIEFSITSKTSLINQREVVSHTNSFGSALRAALREDPDIILIGEMRDLETITLAMTASETGHLVIGTMNTVNATATVQRIVDTFPGDQKAQVRIMLSGSLRSIISQKLIRTKAGNERVLAAEVLINTKNVGTLIREGKTFLIKNAMQLGKSQGMVTMDESLVKLVKDDRITPQSATENAENPEEVRRILGTKVVKEGES